MRETNNYCVVSNAIRQSLKNGYLLDDFKCDFSAGLIVSLVALPLAMALAIAVGLPPQHGLYTAIVAGIITPLVGGSIHQVSGPTAAFVVVIAPIVATHGVRGLVFTTLLAGIILVFLGVARLGRYIHYMPYPVTAGFTSGIAVVIGVITLNDFLGLHITNLPGDFLEKLIVIVKHFPNLYWPEALIGILSLLLMFTSRFFIAKIPSPVIGIGVGVMVALVLQHYGFEIATIGNRFSYQLPSGVMAQGIPHFLPSFHLPGLSELALFKLPSFSEIKILSVPALIVAALGALESLLSASVADGMARTKHNPNAELVGIGIGNLLSGLAIGMPATGAIARTATNIQNGGKTPLAALLHGVFIMFYVLFFASYISYVPMASLAALLLITAYRMSHWQQFIRVIKIGPLSDALVLLACFAFTVLIDMVAGVTVGIILACFLLVKRLASLTQIQINPITKKHLQEKNSGAPPHTIIYQINGSLFFGNVEEVIEQIEIMDAQIKNFILNLAEVPFIDITGLIAIKRIILDLQKNNKLVVICGRKEIINRLQKKLHKELGENIKITESLEQALTALASA